MRFLPKPSSFLAAHQALRYPKDRKAAMEALTEAQHGFCAYSERRLKPLDSVEVEHFDPRLKKTESDSIANWHAVIRWVNAHKARKIENFEPLPDTQDAGLPARVTSQNAFLHPVSDDDQEVRRLLEFLGVNRPEMVKERRCHLSRIRYMMKVALKTGDDVRQLVPVEELSFATTLEAELGLPAGEWISASNGFAF